MSPETVTAVVGAVGVVGGAVVSAIPAALGLRRARGAAQEEGAATRDTVETLGARLEAKVGAVRDELRSDVAELREDVMDVRAWQAGHDAEHMLMARRRPEQ
ncbi:hypothetical protein [Kitasatospora fiedleri]|uniref:hypothetical protein n=1 Tax=Kitasatospora fiedleri TaxID=2991545 RepID=UPI000C2CAC06|nr:hypothetical protein [Kitasatospora fiedleri]